MCYVIIDVIKRNKTERDNDKSNDWKYIYIYIARNRYNELSLDGPKLPGVTGWLCYTKGCFRYTVIREINVQKFSHRAPYLFSRQFISPLADYYIRNPIARSQCFYFHSIFFSILFYWLSKGKFSRDNIYGSIVEDTKNYTYIYIYFFHINFGFI